MTKFSEKAKQARAGKLALPKGARSSLANKIKVEKVASSGSNQALDTLTETLINPLAEISELANEDLAQTIQEIGRSLELLNSRLGSVQTLSGLIENSDSAEASEQGSLKKIK